MASKNDITGDSIQSKIGKDQKAYADGWELAFGKKKKEPVDEFPTRARPDGLGWQKDHEGSLGTDRNPPSGTDTQGKEK